MPLQTIPLDLSIKEPPILPTLQGGNVLIPGPYDPPNKPKVIWAQNVVPTDQGFASVLYNTYVSATDANAADQADMMRVYTIWDQTSANATFYFYANGNHVVLNPTAKTWSTLESGGLTTRPISIAYVRGKSYVYDGVDVYKFDTDFTSMISVPITGITVTDMLGFTSAQDYAIAWDEDTIYWSAPGDPGQFSPLVGTLVTGAGSSKIVELVGKIKICHRIAGGFIIYGSVNMVSARYSGNSRNPWIFKGLKSSAAISRLDGVYSADASDTHFVFTNEGIKEVNMNGCETIFPELGKFLSGWVYYTSDGDGTFTKVESLSSGNLLPLAVKCSFIGDRYFAISFGEGDTTSFPFALLFDVGLQQWGMLKIDHVDLFEFIDVYQLSGTASGATGWGLIGVLSPTGAVYSVKPVEVDTALTVGTATVSEVIFREIRATRNRTSNLNRVEFTGYMDLASDATYDVKVMSYWDSLTGQAEVDFDNYPAGSMIFINDTGGQHHQLRIAGKFNLTSGVVDLNIKGTI
jgi:hypothetical protein